MLTFERNPASTGSDIPNNGSLKKACDRVFRSYHYSALAGFLPVKMLVELLNFSLANDVAGKVTSVLAMELDRRLKKSLLGDENYTLGDATKRTILVAIKNYTGKGWIFLTCVSPPPTRRPPNL